MKKLRSREKKFSNSLAFSMILLLLTFFIVGFAYIQNGVQINGDFSVSNNSWNVHLEKGFTLSNEAVVVTEPTITNQTNLYFQVNLSSAKSYYEVYTYIVNSGAVDAKLSQIVLNDIPEDIRPYIQYTMEYGDGEQLQVGDILQSGDYEQVKITVRLADNFEVYWIENHPELESSPDSEDVIIDFSFDFTCFLKYEQLFGDGRLRTKTSLIKSLGLDQKAFTTVPSFTVNPTADTSGLYVDPATVSEKYPIYYYRGIVSDNNVIFAEYCWKIVRTTDKGGTKLVYNGKPSNGQCNNTGSNTRLSTATMFNSSTDSLADVGYMYGIRYTPVTFTSTESYIFGNDVLYDEETGMYTLTNTATTTATVSQSDGVQRHYTCKSDTLSTCRIVYYVYTNYSSTVYAYALSGVNGIEEAKEMMFTNTNESATLKTLNTWYEENIENKDYSRFIEEAVWCNDRTIVGGALYSKDTAIVAGYGAYFGANNILNEKGRGLFTNTPNPAFDENTACPNENDRFTTTKASFGNKKLKYSVGLLTADEVTLAGNGYKSYNTSAYLYTGQSVWTMTPSYYAYNIGYNFYLASYNNNIATNSNLYVRPSIVLKAYTKVSGGTGTTANPYVIADK